MVSPESRRIRSWLVQNVKQAARPATISEARAVLEALVSQKPVSSGTRVQTVSADGVPGEWLCPPDTKEDKVILYLHGGAYTMGSVNTARALVSFFSAASGCCALVVDYRLAPEHPFPAAVEDATAAYHWLLDRGAAPGQLVIAGDSAGGGLALSLLVSLRDAGVTLPAGAALFSPWTDLACSGVSMISRADADPWLTPEHCLAHAALYAGGMDPKNPLISPLYADLHSLPPLFIHAGSDEILLDDSTRVAERARAAGVSVTLSVWEGMWHVWHYFAPQLPEAAQAIEQAGRFVREITGR